MCRLMNYYYKAHTHITTSWVKTEQVSTPETSHVPPSFNSLHTQ